MTTGLQSTTGGTRVQNKTTTRAEWCFPFSIVGIMFSIETANRYVHS